MELNKIIENRFEFQNLLTERLYTNRIIIHHTGAALDASAAQIHQWHIEKGYAGIGYHFVIRKNGAIERGRPLWAQGAHAYGANWDSVGIHLSGEFFEEQPTPEQIEACAMLIADIAAEYDLPIDRKHIKGHCEVNATDCPGVNLFEQLPTICGKANWYLEAYSED